METQTVRIGRPVPWRRAVIVLCAVVGLGLVGAVLAAFFWLRSYAPLGQGSFLGGPLSIANGRFVQPVQGSGGVPVIFPRYRPDGRFQVRFSVRNRGRFDVTVLGLRRPTSELPVFDQLTAEVSAPNDFGTRVRPLDAGHSVRIPPREERTVTITYRIAARCKGGQPRHYWGNVEGTSTGGPARISFRVRYARFFERTQRLALPFAMVLVCRVGVIVPTR